MPKEVVVVVSQQVCEAGGVEVDEIVPLQTSTSCLLSER